MDRGRFFSVPPLEEIKKAKSVSHEKGPTLFESARGKESSTVGREPTGAGDGPDVKQVGSGGTEGGGAIVHREASSKHSVVSHTRGSSNQVPPQTLAGTQTSTASSSTAGFSRSGSLKAGGPPQQQDNQVETTGTGASGLTGGSQAGAGGLTGGSRAGAGGLTGGSRTGAGGLTGGSRTGAGGLTGGSRTGASGLTGGSKAGAGDLTGGSRTGASGLTGGSRTGAGGLTGGSRTGAGGLTGGSRTGAGGLTGGSRTGASGLAGGSLESGSTVSTTGESSSSVSATTVAPVGSHHHPHAILTNPVQKNNPVMKYIRNVPWELGDIVPDFVLGRTTCALFLSVRYHSLHPDYVHTRLKELGKQYELRVLLVLVDVSECQKALSELAKIALLADLTLVLAWSYEEAGRYLETYKAYENKPPDLLMERVDSDFSSRVTECLTTVKKVNKTDAATLLNTFKTMERVITASREELTLCPGLGPQKAQRLHNLFREPFIPPKKAKLEL